MDCKTKCTNKSTSCKGCSNRKLDVLNWLQNLPEDEGSAFPFIEVSFNNGSRKDFFELPKNIQVTMYDWIMVESSVGYDIGMVSLLGTLVRLQMKKQGIDTKTPLKKVVRIAKEADLQKFKESKSREKNMLIQARIFAKTLKLDMKISEVELQADGRKAIFYYIADERIDFRELIKIYAKEFFIRVEMKQIGARQEAAKVGGIGSCGKELCCSVWLSDFNSVNINMVRHQNLSINSTKLTGQCGRLKCCLSFELDVYLENLQAFPKNIETLPIQQDILELIKKDILKKSVVYQSKNTKVFYTFTLLQLQKLLATPIGNRNLQNIENIINTQSNLISTEGKENTKIVEFIDAVGQTSLQSLSKKKNNRHYKKKNI